MNNEMAVFIDLEGDFDLKTGEVTNPSQQSGVLEISALFVSQEKDLYVVTEVFHTLVRPQGQISWFPIKNVHGLRRGGLFNGLPYESALRHLNEVAKRRSPSFVVGQGSDIDAFQKRVPSLAHLPKRDLDLGSWEVRMSAPYAQRFVEEWSERRPLPVCQSAHGGYAPSKAYSRSKGRFKVFYGCHCALKDTYFMLSAANAGIPFVSPPQKTKVTPKVTNKESGESRSNDSRPAATPLSEPLRVIREYVRTEPSRRVMPDFHNAIISADSDSDHPCGSYRFLTVAINQGYKRFGHVAERWSSFTNDIRAVADHHKWSLPPIPSLKSPPVSIELILSTHPISSILPHQQNVTIPELSRYQTMTGSQLRETLREVKPAPVTGQRHSKITLWHVIDFDHSPLAMMNLLSAVRATWSNSQVVVRSEHPMPVTATRSMGKRVTFA